MDTGRGRGRAIATMDELTRLPERGNCDVAGSENRRPDLISASVFGRALILSSSDVARSV